MTPTPTIRGLPRPLARALEAHADRLDIPMIRAAYDLAVDAHAGQLRASGEEYVQHTIEVATILAQLRLDTATIIAGLIHDTVEDTEISIADVKTRFGEEVAQIVDGVTKLGKVEFRSATEHQVENYRKMLLSMATDARVILVKLADRLHNMRTLEHLPEPKQRAHRPGDAGDLRAARPPPRDGRPCGGSWRTWPSSSSSRRPTTTSAARSSSAARSASGRSSSCSAPSRRR